MTRGTGQILVLAEDQPGLAALELSLLDRGLHVLRAAPSGAVRMMSDLSPDLVLVDPTQIEGRAAEMLSAPEAGMILVAMVAAPSPGRLRRAMELGARDFLVQPLSEDGEREAEVVMRTLGLHRRKGEMARRKEAESVWRLKKEITELKERYLRQCRAFDESQDVFYLDLSRMMTIFDNIMDGIVFTDPEGQVTLMNPVAEDLLGVKSFVAIGRPLSTCVRGKELVDEIVREQEQSRESGEPSESTFESLGPGGAVEYHKIRTTAVTDYRGSFAGILTVIKDVTAECKSDQMKNQYLSIVSHELRTPLTGIKTFATMMGKGALGKLPENQQRVIDSIREQSLRLEHEIDKLISLGRIESGDFAMDLEVFPIDELLRMVSEPFRQTARDRGIDLVLNLPEESPLVEADRDDLRRALQALVENAIKFTQDGGKVRISLATDADVLRVKVEDNGPGIEPKHRKRIFEKYFQVENPLTRHHGGAGLGLSVARGVAEAHGGFIEVESEPGRGAEFTVCLPVWREDEDYGRNETETASLIGADEER